jgi:hypothetical protein
MEDSFTPKLVAMDTTSRQYSAAFTTDETNWVTPVSTFAFRMEATINLVSFWISLLAMM